MTKQEKQYYREKKPIAVFTICNFGGVEILDANENSVVYRFNFGKPQEAHKARINHGLNVSSFRTTVGYSIRLNDCIRV